MILECIPAIRGLALGMRVPSQVDRDDLFGAGLLGLVQASKRFNPARGIPFKVWGKQRAHGAMLDYLRSLDPMSRLGRTRAKRDGEKGPVCCALGETEWIADKAEGQESRLIRRERIERLRLAVEELPDSERYIVKQRLAGRPVEDIARSLGMTVDGVQYYRKRAYDALYSALDMV